MERKTMTRPGETVRERGVTLRATDPADPGGLREVLGERGVGRWWSLYDDERRAARLLGRGLGVFIIDSDGHPAGAIEWVEEADIDYRHARMDMILAKEVDDPEVGADAVRLLARYLFSEKGHHRLVAAPGADSPRSREYFARAGFREVGLLRSYERQEDGSWQDCVLMELLADGSRV